MKFERKAGLMND